MAIGNVGSDQGQLAPMVAQLAACYGKPPREMLVDGGSTKLADIKAVSASGETTVCAPVTKPRDPGRDPMPRRHRRGSAWRDRMATAEAKTIDKDRAATAECDSALARNRGLRGFLVRGLAKAKTVAVVCLPWLTTWRVPSAWEPPLPERAARRTARSGVAHLLQAAADAILPARIAAGQCICRKLQLTDRVPALSLSALAAKRFTASQLSRAARDFIRVVVRYESHRFP